MGPPKITTKNININHALCGPTTETGPEKDEQDDIPIEELITMYGVLQGQQVTILKEDGCNTNVISRSFVKQYRHLLNVKKACFVISHSSKSITETATNVVIDASIQIGEHVYSSNWVISDCRYDILLGMQWHIHCSPIVDYEQRTVKVGRITLPTIAERNPSIKVNNIGVKKFRSLLGKKHRSSSDFMMFQVRSLNNIALASASFSIYIEDM